MKLEIKDENTDNKIINKYEIWLYLVLRSNDHS